MKRWMLLIVAVAAVAPGAMAASVSDVKPAIVRWGATVGELQRELAKGDGHRFVVRRINPPFLPRIKDRQMQIDVADFEFLGRRRHVEFVLGDNCLQMVWIMVAPAEQERVVQALTAAYGPPDRRNRDYIAWTGARAAWRFKPAEVLFYSPELDADMAPDFAPESAG